MTAAEFSAHLLADFHHRIQLESLSLLSPSPHPFGVGSSGPFGGGPRSIPPAHDRLRGDYQPPSHLMLQVMAQPAANETAERAPNPVYQGLQHVAESVPGHERSFKPASTAISPHERAEYVADSTAAQQKRRLLDSSGGVECSYMGVGSGTGVWDAGSEETARRVATLQARLQQRLGPEYVSTRAGPSGGPRVSYIEGWKAIELANEVFGFNGWSSSIVSLDVDFLEENPQTGRVNVAVSATVRITLRDGTYHEDVGYGSMDNSKSRAAALEKSKKEAVTDAIKRTLRTFGSVLGNCLYDKQFLRDISKVTLPPVKFDPSTLHRRPEFANAANVKKVQSNQPEPSVAAAPNTSTSAGVAPPAASTTLGAGTHTRTATMPAAASVSHSRTAAQSHPPNGDLGVKAARSHTTGPTVATSSTRQTDTAHQGTGVTTVTAESNVSDRNTSSSGAGPGSDSDRARQVEQNRLEAQKRLARTLSIQPRHAETSRSASTSASAVVTTTTEAAREINPKLSTPFGPRFMSANNALTGASTKTTSTTTAKPVASSSKSKYPDDSAIFFAASDDESRELESSRSDIRLAKVEPVDARASGGAANSKRMLLDNDDRPQTDYSKSIEQGAEDEFELDANDLSDSQLAAIADKTPFRGKSVGRFTGLTPRSAALLQSGTTSLSAAAAGASTAVAASHTSPESASPSSTARKHSLCGPLQPRRSNNLATGQAQSTAAGSSPPHAAAKPINLPSHAHHQQRQQQRPRLNVRHRNDQEGNNPAGLENLGLAERVSGVGIGVGRVSGRPTVAAPGRTTSMVGGGAGFASKPGFAPASLAMSTARPAESSYGQLGPGATAVKRYADNASAGQGEDGGVKRVRR